MIRKTLAATLTSLTVLAAAAGAQEPGQAEEPPLAFPAEVEQVTVDVVVVDKEGQPITDLIENDIEIYEDGARQAIASFDLFQVVAAPGEAALPPEATAAGETAVPPEPPAPPLRPKVSTNTVEEERQGRTFVIVFDDAHLTAYTAHLAKAAVAEFLRNETREGDRVTLLAPGAGAWWSTRMMEGMDELVEMVKGLEARVFPRTSRDALSDFEAMRIHVFRDYEIMNRVHRRFAARGVQTVTELDRRQRGFVVEEDPFITNKAAETYYEVTARNHATLGAMERALNALVPIQGRKSLILVSEGFIYDFQLPEFKRIITASRRANTAIYFLYSRGLEGIAPGMSAEFQTIVPEEDLGFAFATEIEETGGSQSLAADTGGFSIRNSNDLTGGLKRIADETRAYYLIGYNPTNTARDGRFRKIEVKIPGRKGIQIRARKGYFAPSDGGLAASTPPGTDPVFQRALDSPYDIQDIGLRMTHFVREETFVDKAKVYVAAEVDIRNLEFEEQEGRDLAALQFLLVAMNRGSGEYFRYDQKMDLKLLPETREQLSRTWLPIVREFELGPGDYRAKIVVKDRTTGRFGTVDHDFEISDLEGFRASTPVLSDMRETTEDGRPGDRLALLARRDFTPEASLFCQLEVYGAVKLQSSGLPRVTMGYEVRRSDGTLFTNEAPSLILPTPAGGLSRMIGFSLEWATPGEYELVVNIEDELSGKKIEVREPFRVTTAPAPAQPAQAEPPATPPVTTPTGR